MLVMMGMRRPAAAAAAAAVRLHWVIEILWIRRMVSMHPVLRRSCFRVLWNVVMMRPFSGIEAAWLSAVTRSHRRRRCLTRSSMVVIEHASHVGRVRRRAGERVRSSSIRRRRHRLGRRWRRKCHGAVVRMLLHRIMALRRRLRQERWRRLQYRRWLLRVHPKSRRIRGHRRGVMLRMIRWPIGIWRHC